MTTAPGSRSLEPEPKDMAASRTPQRAPLLAGTKEVLHVSALGLSAERLVVTMRPEIVTGACCSVQENVDALQREACWPGVALADSEVILSQEALHLGVCISLLGLP